MILLDFMDNLARWVFINSLKASVLILIILTVQYILKNRFSPKWQNMLWILLILRLLLPARIESRYSMYNLFQKETTITKAISALNRPVLNMDTEVQIPKMTPGTIPPRSNVSLNDLLVLLWMSGVCVLTLITIINNVKCWQRIRHYRLITDPFILKCFEECKKQMSIRYNVRLGKLNSIKIPMLYGWLKPVIILPASQIERYDLEQIEHIICHELAHFKRQDIIIAHISAILQILHWFNPLMWLAFYKIRLDREVACDAIALNSLGREQAKAYGKTILSLLENITSENLLPLTVGIVESKKQIKRRLTHILRFSKPTRFRTISAVILMIVIGCLVLTESKKKQSVDNQSMKITFKKQPLILLDPGHGGRDPGAHAFDGTKEKDYCLSYSLYLKEMLEAKRYKVELTRNTDTFIGLKERLKIADKNNADMLISVHFSAHRDRSYNGYNIWYGKYDGRNRLASKHLSKLVFVQLHNESTLKIEVPNSYGFYILSHPSIPSILIEPGFITNEDDLRRIKTPEFKEMVANGLIRALNEYFTQSTHVLRLEKSGNLFLEGKRIAWKDIQMIYTDSLLKRDLQNDKGSKAFQSIFGGPQLSWDIDDEAPMSFVYQLRDSLAGFLGESTIMFPDGAPPNMPFKMFMDSIRPNISIFGDSFRYEIIRQEHFLKEAVQAFNKVAKELADPHPGASAILEMKYTCINAAGIDDVDFDDLAVISGTSALFAHDPDDFMPKYSNLFINMDRRIADASGIQFERIEFGDIEEAWQKLKEHIDLGKPLIGWHWENVLFCGYKESDKIKNRKIFAIAVGPDDYQKWWSWKEFKYWYRNQSKGHYIQYAQRIDPLPQKEIELRILYNIAAWSVNPPEHLLQEYPKATFGLVGIQAYANTCSNLKKYKDWTACHDIQQQWGPRRSTAIYLGRMVKTGLFPEDVNHHLLSAATAYHQAYQNWRELYRQIGWESPRWAGRSKSRRMKATEAVWQAYENEKQGVQEIQAALTILGFDQKQI